MGCYPIARLRPSMGFSATYGSSIVIRTSFYHLHDKVCVGELFKKVMLCKVARLLPPCMHVLLLYRCNFKLNDNYSYHARSACLSSSGVLFEQIRLWPFLNSLNYLSFKYLKLHYEHFCPISRSCSYIPCILNMYLIQCTKTIILLLATLGVISALG